MTWTDYGTCWALEHDGYFASIVRGTSDPTNYYWRVRRFDRAVDWGQTKSLQSARENCEQKIRELISENLSDWEAGGGEGTVLDQTDWGLIIDSIRLRLSDLEKCLNTDQLLNRPLDGDLLREYYNLCDLEYRIRYLAEKRS